VLKQSIIRPLRHAWYVLATAKATTPAVPPPPLLHG
jgi:hypothetical protein